MKETESKQYKHSIVDDPVGENVIHTSEAFNKLKAAWKECLESVELSKYPKSSTCKVCSGGELIPFFKYWGFEYDRCNNCASIFLNPCPPKEIYTEAFNNRKITTLLLSEEYQEQINIRFKRFIQPLLEPLFYFVAENNVSVLEMCGRDINVIDTLVKKEGIEKIIRYRPAAHYESEKIKVVNNIDEIKNKSCDIAVGLQSFESMLDPVTMFSKMSVKVKKGGNILILARAGSGFDIQLLKDKNDSLIPFEHMNLISLEGYEELCTKNSLVIKEMSTPGLMDTNYIKARLKEINDAEIIKYLFEKRSEEVIKSFQKFLQMARLSSSLRLICTPTS